MITPTETLGDSADLRRIVERVLDLPSSGHAAASELATTILDALGAYLSETVAPLQSRVQPWMQECFGAEVAADRLERGDRFLEEALELLQSGDYPRERILALVDYVYGRDKGDPAQEAGGVMLTLAAYCLAHGLDMHKAGDEELARVWGKIEKIRAKQAAKPHGSALPMAVLAIEQRVAARDVIAERRRQIEIEGWSTEHDDEHDTGEMAWAAVCYLQNAAVAAKMRGIGLLTAEQCDERSRSLPMPEIWPWGQQWWKPAGLRRNLVKAAALVIAEIERLDRVSGDAP